MEEKEILDRIAKLESELIFLRNQLAEIRASSSLSLEDTIVQILKSRNTCMTSSELFLVLNAYPKFQRMKKSSFHVQIKKMTSKQHNLKIGCVEIDRSQRNGDEKYYYGLWSWGSVYQGWDEYIMRRSELAPTNSNFNFLSPEINDEGE